MIKRNVNIAVIALLGLGCLPSRHPAGGGSLTERYRADANKLIAAALADSSAWDRLATLTDTYGHRLSGSASLEAAIDWILAEMKRDGLENVRGEPAMVPHWVRGEESAYLVSPRPYRLHMLGLGRSIGTPRQGITAPVMVVSSFDEFSRRTGEAKGKIVLFDAPFRSYGETVRYRSSAAITAARAGAVAALIRSVASASIQSPHTGAMSYDSTVVRIPAAALSVEDAMMLHRMSDRGQQPVVKLTMGARTLPDAPSRNVVAELRGRERPSEIVIVGGHIDSWDVGQGAMDDGGGSVAAWEAVRLMKKLGLRPKRTVRVVMWTNEENGSRGAEAYRATHAAELDKHVMAFESDNGVFKPLGYQVAGDSAAFQVMRQIAPLMSPIGANTVRAGGPEADVDPLNERGVPTLALAVEGSRYFNYHHSEGDTMDKLSPRDMAECVAMIAVAAYVVADMPGTLGRAAIRQTRR
ncbi:MAG TPA: M28 family metallopeptidase [Gemmatimonadaceae bacterium]|jgi:carboxypeptidase Q